MIKHIYNVYGISCVDGVQFIGTCVSDDIIHAIKLFRKNDYSVWEIKRKEQVNANETMEIKFIKKLNNLYIKENKL